MTVYGEEAARFVRDAGLGFGEHQAIGWRGRDGRIEAAAIFHEWEPEAGTIEIFVAGQRAWITRGRVVEMFSYPFGFCRLVHGKTNSPTLIRAWARLGGGIWPIPGLHTVVTLTAEQWGTWRDRHGKR